MRWLSVVSATLVVLAALLHTFAGPTASADLVYVSDELLPSSQSQKEFLDLSDTIDGIDPVSHHRLMRFPDQGNSLVLWQGQGEQLIWVKDYGVIDQVRDFEMIMDAKLPEGADVLYQVWSINEQTLIEEFVHTRTESPWGIDTELINELPRGHYVLIALVRTQDGSGRYSTLAQYDQDLQVVSQDGLVLPPLTPRDPGNAQRPDRDEEDGEGAMPAPPLGPVTAEGFTSFDPDKAGRIIYVSSSTGNDRNDGLSPQTAVRSPREGYNRLQNGDWLLFKADDVFTSGIGKWDLSGTQDRPMLVGVYGEGDRPRFNLDNEGVVFGDNGTHHVAFVGLEATQPQRNPDSDRYNFNAKSSTAFGFMGEVSNVLIEDCKISYFAKGIVFQDPREARTRDITIRRNIIRYCWNKGDRGAGIYTNRVRNMRVEENLIDHNGWHPDIAAGRDGGRYQRGLQAHGCYFSGRYNSGVDNGKWDSADNGDAFVVEFHRNIVSRSSANGCQFRLGGNITDNVFYGNPMALYTWTNESSAHRNAILNGTHVDPNHEFYQRGWGMQIIAEGDYTDNVIAHVGQAAAGSHAIVYEHGGARVRDNVFYRWRAADKDWAVWNKHDQILDKVAGNLTDLDGVEFVDPTRDLDSYYPQGDAEDFLDAAASRPRGVWVEQYDPEIVSQWIREGFEVK